MPLKLTAREARKYAFWLSLPPKEAAPNGRYHWRQQRKATTAYRQECCWIIRQGLVPTLTNGVRVSYEFFQSKPLIPDGRATFRDTDNAVAAMKQAQDALMDAGVVPDDSARFVSLAGVVVRLARDSEGKRGVLMTIEEVGE